MNKHAPLNCNKSINKYKHRMEQIRYGMVGRNMKWGLFCGVWGGNGSFFDAFGVPTLTVSVTGMCY
jgi:hypothetical protein